MAWRGQQGGPSKLAVETADTVTRLVQLESDHETTEKRLDGIERTQGKILDSIDGLRRENSESRRPNLSIWLYAAALFGGGAMFIISTQVKPVETRIDGFSQEQRQTNQALRDGIMASVKSSADALSSYMAQEREVIHSHESQLRELVESKTGVLRERIGKLETQTDGLVERQWDDFELLIRNDQALIDFGIKDNSTDHVLQGKKHKKKPAP